MVAGKRYRQAFVLHLVFRINFILNLLSSVPHKQFLMNDLQVDPISGIIVDFIY